MKKTIVKLFVTNLCFCLCTGFLSAQPDFIQWATTPPMGWNSWDCYVPAVEEHEVKANADYMAQHLIFGREYIVVDIRRFVENDKAGGYNKTDPCYVIDEYGRYLPAINRFPSTAGGKGFKPLADYVHSKGLKFGVHIMRGVPRQAVEKKLPIKGTKYTADQIYSTGILCTWLNDNYTVTVKPGGQEYYNSIMELYASWGVDFLKIDDLSSPYHKQDEKVSITSRNATIGERYLAVFNISDNPEPVEIQVNIKDIGINKKVWQPICGQTKRRMFPVKYFPLNFVLMPVDYLL